MKIAIVGTGISGLVCAHHLHRRHDVIVFEANDYVGGHTHTVDVALDGRSHAVDTGFIVYNEDNYPEFTRLLDELGVATRPTSMSFSVRDETSGLEYRAAGLHGVFAQRANLVDPRFGRMLVDVVRFNRRARALLDRHQAAVATGNQTEVARLESWTLDDLVAQTGCAEMFVTHYLVPLGAAIWSADPDRFTRFPAVSWSRFMDNHGLLHVRGTPHWRTVTGGSRRYVDALIAPFADRIRLATPVTKIRRHRSPAGRVEVEVLSSPTGPERFDAVILASHSDQALRLLSDPSEAERDILGALTYQPNVATLHTDAALPAPAARGPGLLERPRGCAGPRPRRRARHLVDLLDERPPGHRVAPAATGHLEPSRRDRSGHGPGSLRLRPSRVRPGRPGRPAPSPRDPGRGRDLVRRRLLGLRLPRGRGAVRTRRVPVDRRRPVMATGATRPVRTLYEGWVGHDRPGPPEHRFRARATLVLLDLAELDDVVDATPLWSAHRWAPVQFRRRDYLDGTDQALSEALAELVEARTGRRPAGSMRMLTQLRRFGWLFNPLSIYWCDGADGSTEAVVLEVTNTPRHERHWYVLDGPRADGFAKELHVSPFLPMDLTYRLRIDRASGGAEAHRPSRLEVRLEAQDEGRTVLDTHLDLRRIELTPAHAVASLVRHPLATVGVSANIHRQAGSLWAKRAPVFSHPDRRSDHPTDRVRT